MSAPGKWYFDMIKAQLELAESAAAGGFVARARDLVEAAMADCRSLLAEMGTKNESK